MGLTSDTKKPKICLENESFVGKTNKEKVMWGWGWDRKCSLYFLFINVCGGNLCWSLSPLFCMSLASKIIHTSKSVVWWKMYIDFLYNVCKTDYSLVGRWWYAHSTEQEVAEALTHDFFPPYFSCCLNQRA